MGSYYFLVASLPFLAYENTEALPPEEFLKGAEEQLSHRDIAVLRSARLEPDIAVETESPTLRGWNRFELGLRNELVRLRAAKLSAEPANYLRADTTGREWSDESGIGAAARDAVSEESPLSGEDALGRSRWEKLDELETGHFFDIDRLVIYYLKLQLLARRRLFDREEGEKAFRSASERIMNEYYQEQGDV